MQQFDESLLTRLARLPDKARVAFCASVCERLLPSFARFAAEEAYEGLQDLRQCLDLAWVYARGNSIGEVKFSELSEQAENIAPEPGDFTSDFASAALDAANAIAATLRCCEANEVGRCLEVATYGRDSVDMYIQIRGDVSSEDPFLEDKIVAHPLMQRELARQLQAIEALESAREVDESVTVALKSLRGDGALFG